MKYFENCATLDDLKKAYRSAAMKHHPDVGGDPETMKQINNDYAARFEILKSRHNETSDEYHKTTETADEFRDIVATLLRLDDLEIELCGSWLWIGGNTIEHKDTLKAAGCRWSSNKKLWYWHHPEEGVKWRKRKTSMQEIRTKYGSETIQSGRRKQLEETA